MRSSFKTVSQKIVFSCPYYKVREDGFIYPSGADGRFWVVDRPTADIAVVLDEDSHTYLVGQYRYAIGKYSWEFPMGSALENEPPVEGAKRELLEETGITAQNWEEFKTFYVAPGLANQKGVICLAREITVGDARPEETEELQVKKIKLEDVYKMAQNGEITDGLTLTTLLLINNILTN